MIQFYCLSKGTKIGWVMERDLVVIFWKGTGLSLENEKCKEDVKGIGDWIVYAQRPKLTTALHNFINPLSTSMDFFLKHYKMIGNVNFYEHCESL